MSLIKTFTNLAKGGASALSSVTSYVDGQLEKKHNAEFQDKLSAKPRKEYGNKIMTDSEVEQFNQTMQKYIEIDKQAKKFAEEIGLDFENKNNEKHITKNKNGNLKKMKQSRNLQTTEIDEDRHEPKIFWDNFKYWWKYYDAAKRDDTALFYFGHSKNGGKDGHTCKDRIKQ